jgi:PhnO protein
MDYKINIRPATIQDVNIIYEFMCVLENKTFDFKVFKAHYEANLDNSGINYYVADQKGQVVGFISYHMQYLLHHCGLVGEIQEFFVDEAFRNKGVGRMLMQKIETISSDKGIVSIEVTTNKKRTENVQKYQKLGFTLSHNKFTKSQ